MGVSLIVTTYNWPQALGLTPASVARQSALAHEVIVADDGSGAETAQTVQVNGYDERSTGWGPEDQKLAARLLHIGIQRNYVRHRAIAVHLYHKSRAPVGSNPFDRLLEETLRTRATRCTMGLDAHLTKLDVPQFDATAAIG